MPFSSHRLEEGIHIEKSMFNRFKVMNEFTDDIGSVFLNTGKEEMLVYMENFYGE